MRFKRSGGFRDNLRRRFSPTLPAPRLRFPQSRLSAGWLAGWLWFSLFFSTVTAAHVHLLPIPALSPAFTTSKPNDLRIGFPILRPGPGTDAFKFGSDLFRRSSTFGSPRSFIWTRIHVLDCFIRPPLRDGNGVCDAQVQIRRFVK